MRWGDPITTTVRGQGRLLGSKLAWVFQSRRRITIFVLIVVVIASSASYGLVTLNNKNAFRAAEDPETELPGFDYIEYASMKVFGEELTRVTRDTMIDPTRLVITTELAGEGYFRLSSEVDRRKHIFSSWDAPQEWKDAALEAEEAPNGGFSQIRLLQDYCQNGNESALFRVVEKAYAQFYTCRDPFLTEAKHKTVVAAQQKRKITVQEFADTWGAVFTAVRIKCQADSGKSAYECLSSGKLFKKYWPSSALDTAYNEFWPDIKSLRKKAGFTPTEIARINSVFKWHQHYLSDWTMEDLKWFASTELEIMLWALPVGKIVGVPLKIGERALVKLAASTRLTRPLAVGYTIAKSTKKIVYTVPEGLLRGTTVQVSEMFARSGLIRKSQLIDPLTIVPAEAPKALELLINSEYIPRGITNLENALSRLRKTQFQNPREIANTMPGGIRSGGTPNGYFESSTGKVVINDEIFRGMNTELWMTKIKTRSTLVHEYIHSYSEVAVSQFWYYPKLGYKPMLEGFTEFYTLRVGSFPRWTVAYVKEREVISATYNRLYDIHFFDYGLTREQSVGLVNDMFDSVMFIQPNQALNVYQKFSDFLRPFVKKDGQEILIGKSDPVYTDWIAHAIEEKMAAGDFETINKFILTLRK